MANRSFVDNILKKDASYHVFFWLSLYIILVVLDQTGSIWYILMKEFVNVAFFAIVVYTNILILFPTYLQKKNLFNHLIALAILALLITPIKTLVLYIISNTYSDVQVFYIKNQPVIFLSTYFIGVASSIYSVMSDWLKTQRKTSELQKQTLQSELRFLKSQINPHFLFNTLNSLYALTLKKSDLAPEIVLKLSEMMRYMLYECNEREVPLSKEVTYVENYLELEKLRQGKKMEISFDVIGEPGNHKIAPLMFIPFIENAFKHGISNQISAGFVDIIIQIQEDSIVMQIENSKAPAKPQNSSKRSGGIGLVNVRRRLNLLYPEKYTLDIEEAPNVYRVVLELTLNK